MLLQSDVAEVPAAEHAAGEQFPWQLKCCSSNGETKLYQLPKKADDLFFGRHASLLCWGPLAMCSCQLLYRTCHSAHHGNISRREATNR